MQKYITRQTTTEHVDASTGEITSVETEKVFNIKTTPETFTMMYNEYLGKLYGIKHLSDIKLITKFCEIAEYNTGRVVLSSATRDEICEQLNISKPNLSKNIKRLKEQGLITGDKGTYIIDAALFWKGDRKARAALLKDKALTVTINFEL